MPSTAFRGRVALVTLGCARNEVDSEELAGRLAADGWELVDDADQADVAVVNTCGFIEQAKQDSIDALLEASELKGQGPTKAVVAVGCLAERYGVQLADSLPEADAVLGFDSYRDLSSNLSTILSGGHVASHTPGDRRRMLPLSPVARQEAAAGMTVPGHDTAHQGDAGAAAASSAASASQDEAQLAQIAPASGPVVMRRRLDGRPWAPLKIASGCDRRCAFCAIPAFRGSFISRPPADILAEAQWLGQQGVREIFLVSENSTSYGKDLGDLRMLEAMLPELAEMPGIDRVRVSYLQPAEMRPGLLDAMSRTPGVVPYFDLSFQHASPRLLRTMRRFGGAKDFLDLIATVRARSPEAGIRSNFIVGFPGETEEDVDILCDFLVAAELDVIGVFGYSDEDGTEAETYAEKVDPGVIAARLARVTELAEQLTAQRAEDRIGSTVEVLIESVDDEGVAGRAQHQGPDVDGVTWLVSGSPAEVTTGLGERAAGVALESLAVGDLVRATVTGSEGVDLLAVPDQVLGARPGQEEQR